MIGKKAPNFSCQAVFGGQVRDNVSLDTFPDKYKVLFFYPKDFTYVCPTELHAFQDRLCEFAAHNTEVIGCSIDTPETHCAWLTTPKKEGGIMGVTYPLLSDVDHTIAQAYGVYDEVHHVAFRGLFILDKENIVQCVMINNAPFGRSIDEVLRLVEAVQFVEKCGQACPANWQEGKSGIKTDKEGLAEYFNKESK